MFIYQFQFIPSGQQEPVDVIINVDDEYWFVNAGGVSLGTMVEDLDSRYGFATEDADLQQQLELLTMALKETMQIELFPQTLKEAYGENLIAFDWDDEGELKLVAHPDTDLIEFASEIRNNINEFVTFDKPLLVLLCKEGSSQLEEIYVN